MIEHMRLGPDECLEQRSCIAVGGTAAVARASSHSLAAIDDGMGS